MVKEQCLNYLRNSLFDELDAYLEEHIDNSDWEQWNFWGIAKANIQDIHGANFCFSKALSLNAENIGVFLNYFTSSFPIGKGKEVMPYLERLLPGMEDEQIVNIVSPNLIEALSVGDLTLFELPKSIYSFLIMDDPVNFLLRNYELIRHSFINLFPENICDENIIKNCLEMDSGLRIDLIKFLAAFSIVYNYDLREHTPDNLEPESKSFENLIIQTCKTSSLIFRSYTLKDETRERMIKEILPHEHFIGLFKSLVGIVASQKFQLAPCEKENDNNTVGTADNVGDSAETKLLSLLNFTHCQSIEEILLNAQRIASELIGRWKIVTPNGSHRFLSLEFYLYIPGLLEDSSVHSRPEQLRSGTFYLHTKSKAPNWSPPIFNRHGIDITCGNTDKNIFGGILIRHISGENNQDGSGRALRALMRGDSGFEKIKRGSPLSNWSDEEKSFFENFNGNSIFNGQIHLAYDPIDSLEISSEKRIGIEETSHAELKLKFNAKDIVKNKDAA